MALSGLFGMRRRLGKFVRSALPARALVPEAKFYECALAAIDALEECRGSKLTGDYLEFGVSRGTSMALMTKALIKKQMDEVRCFGFDSFEGLPPESADEGWVPGDFKSTEESTVAYLKDHSLDLSRIHLIKGWFSDTCNEHTLKKFEIKHAAIIMVDCDIYSASKTVFDFVAPLIHSSSIVICDDWGSGPNDGTPSQRTAFEQFLQATPSFQVRELSTYGPRSKVFLVMRSSIDQT